MAYSTTQQIVEFSGLHLRQVDEIVGTGNGTELDYDLDKDNVIAGTYTLNYAPSGSNSFTSLTETTHYSLDKESGRIVLSGTGVTVVGTSVLYGTYSYTESFSDATLTRFIEMADDEIEKLTGRKWDTPTSYTEYIDGVKRLDYPTTNYPYSVSDEYTDPDTIVLRHSPVTQIDAVYFLDKPTTIAKFFNYDDGTATYTDKTDNVNDTSEADFTLFDSSPAVNDYVYIGCANKFLGLNVFLTTLGTGSPVIDWEYYNGSAWADITETDIDTGASTFTASGKFKWSMPSSWTKISVNSSTEYYYIRGKLTTGYTIAPICNAMAIEDAISEVVHPRNVQFEKWGKISFIDKNILNGTKNIRIDYKYGETSTPNLIQELSALLVALRCYVALTGGSYDDATSYTLGSKAVTIGEVYVNIREVINQYNDRINTILKLLGSRSDFRVI